MDYKKTTTSHLTPAQAPGTLHSGKEGEAHCPPPGTREKSEEPTLERPFITRRLLFYPSNRCYQKAQKPIPSGEGFLKMQSLPPPPLTCLPNPIPHPAFRCLFSRPGASLEIYSLKLHDDFDSLPNLDTVTVLTKSCGFFRILKALFCADSYLSV